ncbi:HD domain-containing phosphohydrolase [Marinitoga lauensis]|uniref:HD domain-containing phosphohydrolase n=1 Tax=Marinitoga lauensis TaxID=2201189 RepID=UPI0014045ADE|nr:HD domain-containing phosphohydrolase [Marinitoga lauensis]
MREKNKELENSNEELLALSEELEDLYKKNEEFSKDLIKMTEILSNLKPSKTLDEFYSNVLEVALEIIPEADYGSIILIDMEKMETKFIHSIGHDIKKLKSLKSFLGEIPKYENIRISKDVINEERNKNFNPEDFKLLLEATKPIKQTLIYDIKLNNKTWIKLTLDIAENSNERFTENSFRLIEGFGNLIKAFWIEKLSTKEIKDAYLRFATKLSIIAEAHDDITGMHIYRVGEISAFIAEKLGLNREKIIEIKNFAPLHDIGKIFIDKNLLRKNGILSDEEFEEIKMHTIYAMKLLDDPYFETAKNIALYHHENHDGTGYPFKLKGKEIPIEAQIVALADKYDALRSLRTYKEGFSHKKVYEIITRGDGRVEPSHFHPEILATFKKYHMEIYEIYEKISRSDNKNNKHKEWIL